MNDHEAIPGIRQGGRRRPRRRRALAVSLVIGAVASLGVGAAIRHQWDGHPPVDLRGPPIEYPPGVPPPPVGREAPRPAVSTAREGGSTRVRVEPGEDGRPGATYLVPEGATPGVRADGPTTRLLGLTVGQAQVDVLAFHRVPEWYSPDELAARALVVLRYFDAARSHTPLRPGRALGAPATTFRWGQPGAFTITEWHLESGGWWMAVTLFRDRRTPPEDVAAARRVLESWRWTPASAASS